LLTSACGKKAPPLVLLPPTKPSTLLIKNVSVMYVDTGAVVANRDVFVQGDRIAGVMASGMAADPPDALKIDGTGATLLPGLIDMHGHVGNTSAPSWLGEMPDAERNLQAYLYSGVTTVLDPAGLDNQSFELRRRLLAGELLGPRLFAAGPMITAKGGHPVAILENLAPWWFRWYLIPHFTRQVDTPEEARAAVQEVAKLGADVIKLAVDRIPEQAPRIRRELVAAAIAETKSRGLRAVAHIGSLEDAIDAADAGAALWLHGVYKQRITDDQATLLAKYQIPMVPTIGVFESYVLLGQGPRAPTALEKETVPAEVLAAFNDVPKTKAGEFFRPYIDSLRPLRPAWRDNVRKLRAAGVTILAGSDTQMGVFPGPGLHRELRLLTEAGLTPAEAIRAATLDAARFLTAGKELEFGLITEGTQADLLLVEGDPTQDLNALSRIRAVIKAGVPVERHAIAN
jgi:imidazolonepropionase-like amidohydrolase